jgi:hypothetical protein
VKFWCSIAFLDPDQVLDVARASEACGYHGVMVADHVVFPEKLSSAYPYSANGAPGWEADTAWLDAWVAIGAMAAVSAGCARSSPPSIQISPRGAGGSTRCRHPARAVDGRRLGAPQRFLRLRPPPHEPGAIGSDPDRHRRRLGRRASSRRPRRRLDREPVLADVALTRVADLGRFRRDTGVSATEGYEVIPAPRGPIDDLDAYRRLEDAGVTGIMTSPLAVRRLGAAGDEVPAHAVETFADRVISRLG